MEQIILVGIYLIVVGILTWETGRLIDALRSRHRVTERLLIDDI